MKIVIANTVGRLRNGHYVVPFPSRWDCDTGPGRQFTYYPYELAYLSSLLKRELKDQVLLIDGNLYGHDGDSYAVWLLSLQPDVIVTECSSLTFSEMTRACLPCKQQLGTRLILTGPHGTYDRMGSLDAGWDHVIEGEYEWTVLRLFKRVTPTWTLDDLPWPDDDNISRVWYWEGSNPYRGMIQVYPTRGCPLACTFCVVPIYYGGHGHSYKSHRTRNVDDVCDEIEHLAMKYGTMFRGCFFNEETHNANMPWLRTFAEALIRRRLNRYAFDAMCGYWGFTTEDDIQLLCRAGYVQLRMGVENVSEDCAKAIKKRINVPKLEDVMRWCRKYGIRVYGTFQIGAPGSTKESDIATMKKAREWRRDGLMQLWQCSISCPQPGTPFHTEAKENGWLVTEDLTRYTGVQAVVSYPHYSAKEIEAVHKGLY